MEYKSDFKQRKNTIQGLRSFKDTLPTRIKKIIHKKGQIYSETLDNWRYIVGDSLFKYCYPKSFKNSNKLEKSCLNIMVKRGHEIDIEYSKRDILKKINGYFGYEIVKKIKLTTFDGKNEKIKKNKFKYVAKNKYKEKISSIKNEKIKSSLLELTKLFSNK